MERENSTILNGALLGVAREVAGTLRASSTAGIHARLFFAQNDGTLKALDHALRFPVLDDRPGPANCCAARRTWTGRQDAIAIDVGGTSTDIGVLVGGSRGNRRRSWRSVASARTSGCPTSCPSRSAAA
ncbi:MAG: hydantoinase/oxoprolinase family protein [Chloroflexota bacterium]